MMGHVFKLKIGFRNTRLKATLEESDRRLLLFNETQGQVILLQEEYIVKSH